MSRVGIEPTTRRSRERMRQCGSDADRFAVRMKQENGRSPRDAQVMNWTNHYNGKRQRCFVEITFYDLKAKEDRKLFPPSYREVYDAIEQFQLAAHTSFTLPEQFDQDFYCRIEDSLNPRGSIRAPCDGA